MAQTMCFLIALSLASMIIPAALYAVLDAARDQRGEANDEKPRTQRGARRSFSMLALSLGLFHI